MLRTVSILVLAAVIPAGIASVESQERGLPQTNADELAAAHGKITQYTLQQDAAAPQNAPGRALNTGTLLVEPQDATAPQNAPRGPLPAGSSDSIGLPVFMTFVNRTSGELVVGLDQNATGTAKQYTAQVRQIANSTVPVRLVSGYFEPQSCSAVDDRCVPLIGGIEISTAMYAGSLTLPAVNNDNEVGFVMSGHTAGPNSTNAAIYQPSKSNPAKDTVGHVITNPQGPRSSDAAFVETFDRIASGQRIFNPGDPANPYDVIGARTSAQTAVFDTVYMAGIANKTIGGQNHTTTAGGVVSKGVTIKTQSYGTLTNQIVAGYDSASGDSGSPIYSKASGNDVLVNGIHVGQSCFVDYPPTNNSCSIHGPGIILAAYSPWEHVRSELNLRPVTGSLGLNTVLDEDFESGLSGWTVSGAAGWGAGPPSGPQVPGLPASNEAARAGGCAGGCVLRSNAVDVSGYGSPQLSFWRLVDPSTDPGEYLGVEVSRDGGAIV